MPTMNNKPTYVTERVQFHSNMCNQHSLHLFSGVRSLPYIDGQVETLQKKLSQFIIPIELQTLIFKCGSAAGLVKRLLVV